MQHALSGTIQIAITTRAEVDLGRDRDEDRRAEMMAHLSMFPIFGTVARRERSTLIGADIWHRPEDQAVWEEVKRIVFPGLTSGSGKVLNKLADIDHLVGHKLAQRDIFVTDDGGILRSHEQLKQRPGILVLSPADCLRSVDAHLARYKSRTLHPERVAAGYHDPRLQGIVTFDYSNNNGRFSIGDGFHLFETNWTKGSDTTIHALNDPSSIEAIALVKEVEVISDIRDATAFDFSARHRTPSTGQIVIWKNMNGIYAATKLVAIKDDSRGAGSDELSFEYRILPDGSADFS